MSQLSAHLNQPEGYRLKDTVLLLVLFGTLFLAGLGSAPLIDPDEGRYAEIPREMLERGDFLTPTLNYVKYFEKPPLLYWLNAGSMKLLGENEFAARLPGALAGLITIMVTYIAARTLFNRNTGLLAALILGSCAGFLMQGRIILTDMLLTCCLSTALFCFQLAARPNGSRKKLFFYLFFIFCGLSVLTKGLIGVVLPAGIIFWFLLLNKRWQLLREIPWFSGLLFFLLVTAPWFILISLKNPEFPYFFFIHEHFQRYTSTIHHRNEPVWFFLPILILLMLPWSFFFPGSLITAWKERFKHHGASLFLLIWPLVILTFFSLSGSKLIPYILPAMPPLALLVAIRLNSYQNQRNSPLLSTVTALGYTFILLGTATVAAPNISSVWLIVKDIQPLLSRSAFILTGSALSISGIIFLLSSRTRSVRLGIIVLCLFGLSLDIVVPEIFNRYIAEELSTRKIAHIILEQATPQTTVAQIGLNQGINFYTHKRLLTLYTLDELTFGSKQGDQSAWFPPFPAFSQMWKSNKPILLVIPKTDVANFATVTATTPRVVFETGGRALLSNH